jgi:hypothetical protein
MSRRLAFSHYGLNRQHTLTGRAKTSLLRTDVPSGIPNTLSISNGLQDVLLGVVSFGAAPFKRRDHLPGDRNAPGFTARSVSTRFLKTDTHDQRAKTSVIHTLVVTCFHSLPGREKVKASSILNWKTESDIIR